MNNRKLAVGGAAVCVLIFILCLVLWKSVDRTPQRMSGYEEYVAAAEDPERVRALCDGRYVTDVEERTIRIPGVQGTYHFLYFSDMHILVMNDEVYEGDREEVQGRVQSLASNGNESKEIFNRLVENANATDLDGVLLGGDIIDFLSEANAEWVMQGLERLQAPYLFVTADHDVSGWWTAYSEEEQAELRKKLDYEPVQVMDFDEFVILGVSENTSQIRKKALEQIKEVLALGKPVIIVQHVPFDSEQGAELRELSKANWGERVLLWGEDEEDAYQPNETTQEYMDLVYAPDSNVAAVLAGHLHFRYEGMVNGRIRQYIFNPAYSGEVALFTVTGDE